MKVSCAEKSFVLQNEMTPLLQDKPLRNTAADFQFSSVLFLPVKCYYAVLYRSLVYVSYKKFCLSFELS